MMSGQYRYMVSPQSGSELGVKCSNGLRVSEVKRQNPDKGTYPSTLHSGLRPAFVCPLVRRRDVETEGPKDGCERPGVLMK